MRIDPPPSPVVMHGDESPVYVYEADLHRLDVQPAQAGFVSVDRRFNAVSLEAT
jgi:hypothetical protein